LNECDYDSNSNVTRDISQNNITSFIYFYYLLGNEVDYDYIMGTENGSLAIFTHGNFKILKKNVH
jgi:hypothetical protein